MSLYDDQCRLKEKYCIFVIISFSANVTYSFRNIVIYVFIVCIYDDVRDTIETLVRKQRTN